MKKVDAWASLLAVPMAVMKGRTRVGMMAAMKVGTRVEKTAVMKAAKKGYLMAEMKVSL